MSFCCVSNDFTDVILCVESSICLRVLGICKWISETFPLVVCFTHAPCHMVSKVRVGIDLKSPACCVSKMQMHDVHLQKRQSVNLLLYEFLALEAA